MRLKRLFFPVIAFLLVTGVILLSATAVFAYSYSGYRWDTNLVNYDHITLPYDWRTTVTNAAYTWNAAPANFNMYYSPSTSNTFTAANFGGGEGIGIAFTNTTVNTGTKRILQCKSYFNTYYPYSIGGGGGTYDVQTVALHEFGHWLMLNDLYSWFWERNKVMYKSYTGVKRSLHQDDINGIVYIYGQ